MALLEGRGRIRSPNPNSPVIRRRRSFRILIGDTLHMGVALSVTPMRSIVWWLMQRTTTGFAIKAVGANPQAALQPASVGGVMLSAAAIPGALAGLAGAGEVGGIRYQVVSDLSSGYGYAGS